MAGMDVAAEPLDEHGRRAVNGGLDARDAEVIFCAHGDMHGPAYPLDLCRLAHVDLQHGRGVVHQQRHLQRLAADAVRTDAPDEDFVFAAFRQCEVL